MDGGSAYCAKFPSLFLRILPLRNPSELGEMAKEICARETRRKQVRAHSDPAIDRVAGDV